MWVRSLDYFNFLLWNFFILWGMVLIIWFWRIWLFWKEMICFLWLVILVLWVIIIMVMFVLWSCLKMVNIFLVVWEFNVLVGLLVSSNSGLLIMVLAIVICCCCFLDNWLGWLCNCWFRLILIKVVMVFFFLVFVGMFV